LKGHDFALLQDRVLVKEAKPQIDFSDIPDSSPEQLTGMRRVGRPPLGKEPRQLIAIRIDTGVLESFRKEARRRHVGYQTLINEVLAEHIRRDVASGAHAKSKPDRSAGITRANVRDGRAIHCRASISGLPDRSTSAPRECRGCPRRPSGSSPDRPRD
jgi:uncharacterized protein (DUF4415 family)